MHSTYSDGTCTPSELVNLAREANLTAMSLTDHDTLAGADEMAELTKKADIRFVSGIEFSSDYPGAVLHIIGYGVNHHNEIMDEHLKWINGGRKARNIEMLRKLNNHGISLNWRDIAAEASGEVIGRPHFAAALVKKGVVKHTQQAYRRYIGDGKMAFAERRCLSPVGCIELIRAAGGVPVVAHPYTITHKVKKLRVLIAELAELGLGGLEVYYGQKQKAQERDYLKIAQENNLIATGGSDFHGTASPGVHLGTGRGDLEVRDELFDKLLERLPS